MRNFRSKISCFYSGYISVDLKLSSMEETLSRQDRRELTLLRSQQCPTRTVDRLRVALARYDEGEIREQLNDPESVPHEEETYQVGCLVDAVIFSGMSANDQIIGSRRVREMMSDLRQIGDESVEGYALLGGLGSESGLFVIKVPRGENSLIHEAAVGFLALNPVLREVPNFMGTYGIFFCSAPIIQNKKVIDWCEPSHYPVSYVVFENILHAKSFSDMIRTLTPADFLTCYLQVISGLNIAHAKSDFTHYDLHGGNVLIQKYVSPLSIPYYGSRKEKRWINSNYLAKIIDYGFAHYRYRGENFGIKGFERHGMLPDQSFPMFDAYKLLCFLGADAIRYRRNDLLDMMQKIFNFFQEGSFVSRVQRRQQDRNDYFEVKGESRQISFGTFLAYLEQVFPLDSFSTTEPLNYMMEGESAMTMIEFSKRVLRPAKGPITALQYYEGMTNLAGGQFRPEYTKAIRRRLREKFNADTATRQMLGEISPTLDALQAFTESFVLLTLDIVQGGNSAMISTYRNQLIELAKFHKGLVKMADTISLYTFALQDQGIYAKYEANFMEILRIMRNLENFYARQVEKVRTYVDALSSNPRLGNFRREQAILFRALI